MSEPVCITVYRHHECAESKDLAAVIFRWFRGDPEDTVEAGRGMPVHYRCLPSEPPAVATVVSGREPDAAAQSQFHIAVPLVDENMVVDPQWRDYLIQVATTADLFVPVPSPPVPISCPLPSAG